MKQKLDDRTKYFWKQVIQYFLIVGAIISIFVILDNPNKYTFSYILEQSIMVVGVFAIVILGFVIALRFTDRAHPQKKDRKID
jgi:vacuolar-type H+-ATPase subunit I/STV1